MSTEYLVAKMAITHVYRHLGGQERKTSPVLRVSTHIKETWENIHFSV